MRYFLATVNLQTENQTVVKVITIVVVATTETSLNEFNTLPFTPPQLTLISSASALCI